MFDDATQGGDQSHMHAMAQRGEGPGTAAFCATRFIQERLETAVMLASQGLETAALAALGEGMHTLKDMNPPAHEGYQVWDPENQRFWATPVHIAREALPTTERFMAAVKALREYYERFRRRACQ